MNPGFIVVTHGDLGKAFVETIEKIIGRQENLSYVSFYPNEIESTLTKKLEDEVQKFAQKDGVIIFADILGGMPSRIGLSLSKKYKINIISGVNIPMLLELISIGKFDDFDELTEFLITKGKDSIKNVNKLFKKE